MNMTESDKRMVAAVRQAEDEVMDLERQVKDLGLWTSGFGGRVAARLRAIRQIRDMVLTHTPGPANSTGGE